MSLNLTQVAGQASSTNTSSTVLPLIEQPTQQQCRIVAGPVALLAQLILLVVVLSVLTLKRHHERPRRPWNIWSLDISKQAFSSGAGHFCGMGVAVLAHRLSHASSECGWYMAVYLLDCTQGITLAILLHKLTARLARARFSRLPASKADDEAERTGTLQAMHHWSEALLESGHYGDPPSLLRWGIQVAAWVGCVITARATVAITVLTCLPLLAHATGALERKFSGHPDALLFVVMVGVPVTLNVAQAWVQDQVLKAWRRRAPRRLFTADSDDDIGPGLPLTADIANGQLQLSGGGAADRRSRAAADKGAPNTPSKGERSTMD